MQRTLTRTPGFWILLIVSLAATGVGGWLIAGQIGTMTSTLLDGTATGVEVYVGQSLVVVGAAVLGAGLIGLLLALGLTAARALVPAPAAAPVVVDGLAEPSAPVGATDDTALLRSHDARAEDAESAPDAHPVTSDAHVTAADDRGHAATDAASVESTTDDPSSTPEAEAQNGSSGSTATATNSSVR